MNVSDIWYKPNERERVQFPCAGELLRCFCGRVWRWNKRMGYSEKQAKEVIEKIVKEINFSKKVKSVWFFGHKYTVSFDDGLSCIIKRSCIDDYLDSEGRDGRQAIITCLRSQQRR